MYKYTLKDQWKHYYRCAWKGGPFYVAYEHKKLFVDFGWPDSYTAWYTSTKNAYTLVLYSIKKLKQLPCGGYLVPVTFFNEEMLK